MSFTSYFERIWLPIDPELCWQISMALLHSLWQGVFIAALLAFVLRFRFSVHKKFFVSFVALVLLAASPLFNYWLTTSSIPVSIQIAKQDFIATGQLQLFPINELSSASVTAVGSEITNTASLNSGSDSILDSVSNSSVKLAPSLDSNLGVKSHTAIPIASSAGIASPVSGWSVVVSTLVTLGYIAGVALMLFRLLLGWNRLRPLVFKGATQKSLLPENILNAAKAAANSLGVGLKVPIALFSGSGSAIVIGILRPIILINTSLVSGLTPAQLEQVIAHELAHIKRWDPLTQLIQRLLESLLFFNPAIWFVSRRVSELREVCCDEMVAGNHERADYAQTLVECALIDRGHKPATGSLGACRNRIALSTTGEPNRFAFELTRNCDTSDKIQVGDRLALPDGNHLVLSYCDELLRLVDHCFTPKRANGFV